MSFIIPENKLTKQQLFQITQKLFAERKSGRGRSQFYNLFQHVKLNDIDSITLPIAIYSFLKNEKFIDEEPSMEYKDGDDDRPNSEIEFDKIKGSIKKSFQLRPDQKEPLDMAIEYLKKYSTVLLNLSCNYGKTCMAIYLAQNMGLKWLFLTPRRILKKQALRDGEMVTDENIQVILTGSDILDKDASGYIMSSRVLERYVDDEIFVGIGTVIIDEFHAVITPKILPLLLKIFPYYFVALTATFYRSDNLDSVFKYYIDPRSHVKATIIKPFVHYKIYTSLKPKVKINKMGDLDWSHMLEQQALTQWRNVGGATLATMFIHRHVLILCKWKKQVRSIHKILKHNGFYSAKFMENDLDYDHKAPILISIIGKCGLGFDADFDCCILMTDIIDPHQVVGRIGRRQSDEPTIVIDLVDNFSTFHKHYEKRLKWYINNGMIVQKTGRLIPGFLTLED